MSNMTPFEIRLDLLKMAKELLLEEFYSKKDLLISEWNVKADMAKIHGQQIPDAPTLPSYPTENEIINKATTLNSFVSNSQVEQKTNSKKST
jgi:hypothetical protein